MRATYGFEWQGDNLLLAREALFFTFAEHYIAAFGEAKFRQVKSRIMSSVAYIISWNIWQMDGLKYGLPGYEPYKDTLNDGFTGSLFEDDIKKEPLPQERLCLIKDFLAGVDLTKESLKSMDFHDHSAPKQTFESLVNMK